MAKRQSFDGGDVTYWRPLKRRGKWRAKWVPRGGDKPAEGDLVRHARSQGVESFVYRDKEIRLEDRHVHASRAQATAIVEQVARERRIAFDEARRDPTKAPPKEIPVGQALDEWVETFRQRASRGYIKERTLRDRERDVEVYKRALGEETILATVDFCRVELLFNQLSRGSPMTRGRRHNVSGITLLDHGAKLRRFFTWAQKKGYTRHNPVAQLLDEPIAEDWKRDKREGQSRGQALDEDEIRRLLEACRAEPSVVTVRAKRHVGGCRPGKLSEKPVEFTQRINGAPRWLRLAALMGLQAGLRKSIVCGNLSPGLRWGNVDLDAEVLTIEKTAKPNSFGVVEWAQKGRRPFYAPLHPELAQALRDELSRLGRVPKPTDPIIPINSLDRPFQTALKRAGINRRGVNFQSLRRSFSTRLMGIDDYNGDHMKILMHHKLQGVAHDHYARLDQKVVIERLRKTLHQLPWIEPRSDTALASRVDRC